MSLVEEEAEEAVLDRSYPAVASQIAAIRRAVDEAARDLGAGEDALLQINLAVSEAATNAGIAPPPMPATCGSSSARATATRSSSTSTTVGWAWRRVRTARVSGSACA